MILAEETTGKVGGGQGGAGGNARQCGRRALWSAFKLEGSIQLIDEIKGDMSATDCLKPSSCHNSPLPQRLIDYYGIKLDGKRLVLMIEDPKVSGWGPRCAVLCCAAHT